MIHSRPVPEPFGLLPTIFTFGAAAALLAFMTGPFHRHLMATTSVEPVVGWFLLGGTGVFMPLLALAFCMLSSERNLRPEAWRDRLRFRSFDRGDFAWTAGGLVAIGGATGLIMMGMQLVGHPLDLHPPFMQFEPLGPGRLWILALWLPFWLLNIFAEEILWRGVILPRQEVTFGDWAWLANGVGWLLFHLAFGPDFMVALAPIILVLPYIVQRRRNSWIGVTLHAGLNGPGFLAVAFGLA
jgi:membrane protease YdiL (CAAX protease family)